jgi:hypothetical protein
MNIPTAEEWLSNNKEMSMYDVLNDEGGYLGIDEKALYKIMNEYANLKSKLHVEACKKAQEIYIDKYGQLEEGYDEAYPLENIK